MEELNKFEINKCHQIIINLTELYSKAMSLKIPEGSTDFDIHIDVDKVFVDFGKYNTYSEVYDQMWWSFNFHWCYHAVDALRALNAIYTDVCSKIE